MILGAKKKTKKAQKKPLRFFVYKGKKVRTPSYLLSWNNENARESGRTEGCKEPARGRIVFFRKKSAGGKQKRKKEG